MTDAVMGDRRASARARRCRGAPGPNFESSDRCKDFQERLLAFMDEHIYPMEPVYEEQMRAAGDPHLHSPVIEELKDEARRWGLPGRPPGDRPARRSATLSCDPSDPP